MKKYQNEAARTVAIKEAGDQISRFLTHDYSYAELMKSAAKAQSQIFEIIGLVDNNKRERLVTEDIQEFFFFAIRAFDLLEPFSENENFAV